MYKLTVFLLLITTTLTVGLSDKAALQTYLRTRCSSPNGIVSAFEIVDDSLGNMVSARYNYGSGKEDYCLFAYYVTTTNKYEGPDIEEGYQDDLAMCNLKVKGVRII